MMKHSFIKQTVLKRMIRLLKKKATSRRISAIVSKARKAKILEIKN